MKQIHYRRQRIDGLEVFYRDAGDRTKPAILLLHGFPTASHMFRDLIPELAGEYRVIAPDLTGFGQSSQPSRGEFDYTFDNLAKVMERFTEAIGLERFAIYMYDYGAPVGFRLALRHPERVTAVITQNGNAYREGLSAAFAPMQAYWESPTEENREALRAMLAAETTRFQYLHGVPEDLVARVSSDGPLLDDLYLSRPGNDEIQLDLFYDYRRNVELYPKIQEYLRAWRPPLLAVWGKNDPFFIPAGAEAFRRDLREADVRFFDTGHFALETHATEIGAAIRNFLGPLLAAQ